MVFILLYFKLIEYTCKTQSNKNFYLVLSKFLNTIYLINLYILLFNAHILSKIMIVSTIIYCILKFKFK